MLRHYLTPSLTLAAALSLASSACNPRQTDKRTGAVGDSAVGVENETTTGSARKVGEVGNFQHPESARYDRDLDVWFVSNVNGDPGKKDNNGYISRLKADGSADSLKFIAGGKNKVTLNGPKGLAIVGDTLWVADIDAARAFNKRTGAPIASVIVPQAKFLNDAAAGPGGAVYLTDTGMAPDPKTGMKHVGPDRVYQVAGRKATVALESPQLQGPNGITWDPDEKEFVIVSFLGPGILGWKPGSKDLRPLGSGPGQEDGVEVLSDGRLLVTSWADSSLFIVDNGRSTKVASGIASPADIGINGKTVAVPQLMENKVQFWELP
ncbi:MAG TPA: SMP-30/gluconolactonase/LRE family protein [Gemmatimonadales bacterium]|jgi:sugar lactone lactonase YvrE